MSATGYHAQHRKFDEWAVRRHGCTHARMNGLTRKKAWAEAKRLARSVGCPAYLHREDGSVETVLDFRAAA